MSTLDRRLLLIALASTACGGDPGPPASTYDWGLPRHFPLPREPADNPMSAEKVELGRRLFFDVRLSGNETQSCASCHEQARAFTDGLANAVGSTGEVHRRNAMSLTNAAYVPALTWANTLMVNLEKQALAPMFGEDPVELGLAGKEAELLDRMRGDARYPALFAAAFPGVADPITLQNLLRALSSFERTLISSDAPYDRYVAGDEGALSDSAKRGMDLFFSERTECYHCHAGFNFSDSVASQDTEIVEMPYHNTGLYNVDGQGAYPLRDRGLLEITEREADMGRFRAPTLRNITVTGPYFHDGSAETLDDVIDHYAAAGRTIATGEDAGVGSDSPLKDGLVIGFTLTPDERADLIAFLESLTDETFLTDPRFGPPVE